MEAKKLQILAADNLRFLGEGNEHLVFSIANSDNVLRFRKVLPGDVISREEFMLRVENDMRFTNGIVELLAGPLLTDRAVFIYVEPFLLKKVMKEIKELRDVRRLHKTINRFGLGIMTYNGANEFVPRVSHRSKHGLSILTAFQHSQTSFSLHKSFMPIHVRKLHENSKSSKALNGAHPKSNPESKEISQRNLRKSSSNGFGDCSSSGSSGNSHSSYERNCFRLNHVSGAQKDTSHLLQQIPEATRSMHQDSGNVESMKKKIVGNKAKRRICIELKLKQGFLEPYSGGSLCRFCLKQYVKLKEKIETSKSSYCSQDLFSGDLILMKKALRGLFSSPQNNLKIFSNGKSVPVSQYDEYSYLSDLLIQILLHKLESPPENDTSHSDNRGVISESEEEILESQDQKSTTKQIFSESHSESSEKMTNWENVPDRHCDIVDIFSLPLYSYFPASSLLSSDSILGRILEMQYLGKVSDRQAAVFYKELCDRFNSMEALDQRIADFQSFCETLPLCLPDNNDNVFNILDFTSDLRGEEVTTTPSDISSLTTSNLIELVQQALIAMAFKDFSLMILMEGPFECSPILMVRQSPFWLEQPPSSGRWYKCQATLIDMALKCPSKILEHERSLNELQRILNNLQENGSEPSCCKPKTWKRKL